VILGEEAWMIHDFRLMIVDLRLQIF